MNNRLKFISPKFFKDYDLAVPNERLTIFKDIKSSKDFNVNDFEFYIVASSVYSSKIEGNSLDLNSFMRNRNSKSKQKEVKEIEDLVNAYRFASENRLSLSNFLSALLILSKTLLPKKDQGKIRKHQVGVYDSYSGKPVYIAVEPEFVKQELEKLFDDIAILSARKLSLKETFYYASMLHLWVAKIHPFADGNGRAARLLEKWFLADKTAAFAWSLNSEKYYWDNRSLYYKNISVGFNYYSLNWDRCLPFLSMLPDSLKDLSISK